MNMNNTYDAILRIVPENVICEDDRFTGNKPTDAAFKGRYFDTDDPKLYAANAFGKNMQSQLNNLGRGFSAEVTDFGKWVTVRITYHNFITGRSANKTFLIVFKEGPDGLVMSTSTKWRTISGYNQAISYIKSAAGALQSCTQTKL